MSYVDRSDTKQYSLGGMVAFGGGYALTRAIGPVGWIPAVLGFASFALLKKVVSHNTAVVATLAALIAQTGWFAVGAIALPDQASTILIDLIVNALLLGLIFFRPGYISAGLTVAWNLFGIVVLSLEIGGAALEVQRVLLAHIALRVAILAGAAMIMIYKANPDLLPDPEEEEVYE